jgi:hypothetical protein
MRVATAAAATLHENYNGLGVFRHSQITFECYRTNFDFD